MKDLTRKAWGCLIWGQIFFYFHCEEPTNLMFRANRGIVGCMGLCGGGVGTTLMKKRWFEHRNKSPLWRYNVLSVSPSSGRIDRWWVVWVYASWRRYDTYGKAPGDFNILINFKIFLLLLLCSVATKSNRNSTLSGIKAYSLAYLRQKSIFALS